MILSGLLAAVPPGRIYRVKDINTVPGTGPDPVASAIVAGSTLYLTLRDALWVSDGTPAGTMRLPGADGITNVVFRRVVGDILYFTASDGIHGSELWTSDGTRDGTRMLRDINPGLAGSRIQSVVPFRGELYFGADDGAHGFELWKTDGTSQGTVLAADLTPGSSGSGLLSLKSGGDRLYFSESSFDPSQPSSLYATDGTVSGTRLVRQFGTPVTSTVCAGSCYGSPPGSFVSFSGRTHFIAGDTATGLELWTTDGTPLGTTLVKDVCPGACSGFLWSDGESSIDTPLLQQIGDRLVFFADDGVHGRELWTSDGTEAGTRLIKDIFPSSPSSSWGYGATTAGSLLFFPASDAEGWALWRSDGTEDGTFAVTAKSGSGAPGQITPVGDAVFFSGPSGSGSPRLWKADSAGTTVEIVSDAFSSPTALVNFRGALHFMAGGPEGFSLWKTDGTAAGTSVVRVLNRPEGSSSLPFPVGDLNGSFLFFATDGRTSGKLWRSDGTDSGTQPVAPVGYGGGLDSGGLVAPFRGSLFFTGDDRTHGSELWRTDGTPEGTRLVKDIAVNGGKAYPNLQDSSPRCLTAIGDSLYFGAFDGDHGSGLWKTDGTEAGTVFLKNIFLRCSTGPVPELVSFNGFIYFSAGAPPDFQPGLWRTDGTSGGTELVRTMYVAYPISFGGRLLFFGGNVPEGGGLWTSDGALEGTKIVKSSSGYLTPFVPLKDGLIFFAATADNRMELVRTDGTPSGTITVADFRFGLVGGPLVSAGDRVFFAGEDAEHGVELWTSDGTAAGTHLVRDIAAGEGSSYPGNIVAVGDRVLFTARDPLHGVELWRSDGTAEGTDLLEDISPGPASSLPGNFTRSGSLVYFTADDGRTGIELWAIPISAIELPPLHRTSDVPWRR